jgi:hypothetical protein
MELSLKEEDLKILVSGQVIFKSIPTSIGLLPIAVSLETVKTPTKDEGDLCALILRHADKLTCYNCGENLAEAYSAGATGDKVGVLHIDPGRNNYPRDPDEPAEAYFECMECAQKDKNLLIKVLKSKNLNQIQVDLLSSFLVAHWKEISTSEHRAAFEIILEMLNPGALHAIKRALTDNELIKSMEKESTVIKCGREVEP